MTPFRRALKKLRICMFYPKICVFPIQIYRFSLPFKVILMQNPNFWQTINMVLAKVRYSFATYIRPWLVGWKIIYTWNWKREKTQYHTVWDSIARICQINGLMPTGSALKRHTPCLSLFHSLGAFLCQYDSGSVMGSYRGWKMYVEELKWVL